MTIRLSHPSADIIGSDGSELQGKRIVLAVTGSVSAYKAPDIARGLMRHGADVHVVMTQGALKIIHPDLMEWASGNPVVTELTGKIEHVAFTTGREAAHLVLVAPATANTISKIASGIDDTPVTSYVSSGLGAGIPIMLAPAMHDTMLKHAIIAENVEKLKAHGLSVIPARVTEGKAKLADPGTIVDAVISRLGKQDMSPMRVLVTGGPTVEPIDPVRVITNRSSGKMAIAIARDALNRGAEVTIVYGPGSAEPPAGARVVRANTAQEMLEAVKSELTGKRYDIVVACAAVSDYRPAKAFRTKIQSARARRMTLQLERTPKIIESVKRLSSSSFLVIFKAEHDISEKELAKRAVNRMRETGADMVVVNDVGKEGVGFASDENEVAVIDSSGHMTRLPKASKASIADEIMTMALRNIRRA